MDESVKRFPTREAVQLATYETSCETQTFRSLTTRRVSLVTQMLGVDCLAYMKVVFAIGGPVARLV